MVTILSFFCNEHKAKLCDSDKIASDFAEKESIDGKKQPARSTSSARREATTEIFENQGTPFQFLARFLTLFLPLYTLIELNTIYYSNNPHTQLITSIQATLLRAVGITAINADNILHTAGATFEVIPDCTGLMLIAMLAALLYATRGIEIKPKINALIIGSAVLLIFNQIRLLATLIIFVNFGQTLFELTHFALWIIDSLLVIAIWYYSLTQYRINPK